MITQMHAQITKVELMQTEHLKQIQVTKDNSNLEKNLVKSPK